MKFKFGNIYLVQFSKRVLFWEPGEMVELEPIQENEGTMSFLNGNRTFTVKRALIDAYSWERVNDRKPPPPEEVENFDPSEMWKNA